MVKKAFQSPEGGLNEKGRKALKNMGRKLKRQEQTRGGFHSRQDLRE